MLCALSAAGGCAAPAATSTPASTPVSTPAPVSTTTPVSTPAPAPAPDPVGTLAELSPLAAAQELWRTAKRHIYPASFVETHFTAQRRLELEARAAELDRVAEVAPLFNPFLETLGVSHTQVYATSDVEYALFRSLFSTRQLDQPAHAHLGMQLEQIEGRWYVREVWDGLPADRAGLRRGDRLLTLNGQPFEPDKVCAGGAAADGTLVSLALHRDSGGLEIRVPCLRQNPNASLRDALQNSIRVLDAPAGSGGGRIGYLHLWSGTHPDILSAFVAGVDRLRTTDALVLDLRGGYGGAWYEYLDPFFADRSDFYEYSVSGREGSERFQPEPHRTAEPYDRPMVVLINEGVRSGKEALAYQFRKSGRATLVGTRTRGAFNAGRGFYVDDGSPLMLYLSVAEYRLDDQRIEGVGVAPDLIVPYPVTDGRNSWDPQLAAALTVLAQQLRGESRDRSE